MGGSSGSLGIGWGALQSGQHGTDLVQQDELAHALNDALLLDEHLSDICLAAPGVRMVCSFVAAMAVLASILVSEATSDSKP